LKQLIQTAETDFPNAADVRITLDGSLCAHLMNYGRYDQANDCIDHSRSLSESSGVPLDGIFHYYNARLLLLNGETKRARTAFEECLALTEKLFSPNDAGYLAYGLDVKGRLLMINGDLESAREYYATMYSRIRNAGAYHMSRTHFISGYVDCLSFMGQTGDATDLLEQEIKDIKLARLEPWLTEVLLSSCDCNLSFTYAQENDYDRALASLPPVKSNGGSDWIWKHGDTWLWKGLLTLRLGRDQDYAQFRNEMVRLCSDFDDGYAMGGLLPAFLAGPWRPDLADEKVVRQWMQHARTKLKGAGPLLESRLEFSLGIAHFRLGEFDLARLHLQRALPGSPYWGALSLLVVAQIEKLSAHSPSGETALAKAKTLRNTWILQDTANLSIHTPELLLYEILTEEYQNASNLADATPSRSLDHSALTPIAP